MTSGIEPAFMFWTINPIATNCGQHDHWVRWGLAQNFCQHLLWSDHNVAGGGCRGLLCWSKPWVSSSVGWHGLVPGRLQDNRNKRLVLNDENKCKFLKEVESKIMDLSRTYINYAHSQTYTLIDMDKDRSQVFI